MNTGSTNTRTRSIGDDRVWYDDLINQRPVQEQVTLFHNQRRNFVLDEPELSRSVSSIIATTTGIPHSVGDIIAFMAFGYAFDVHFTLRSVHTKLTDTHIKASYTMTVGDVSTIFAVECDEPDMDFYTTDVTNPELDVLSDDTLLCALPRVRNLVSGGWSRELFRVCGGIVRVRAGFRSAQSLFELYPRGFYTCSCGDGACVCLIDNNDRHVEHITGFYHVRHGWQG